MLKWASGRRRTMRTLRQRWAAGWCLLMVAFLAVIQFGGFDHPPLPLYLLFSGVWLFGAAMLWWFPTFGAIGTALYGVLLGVQLFLMHGLTPMNALLALASFAGSAWALSVLIQRRRSRQLGA
jgi:hypothetical protein